MNPETATTLFAGVVFVLVGIVLMLAQTHGGE